jgi:hypothetical protein
LLNSSRLQKKGRRASWFELSALLFDGKYGAYAIRSTLRRLGFKRYVAQRKPPINEATREKRLQFALSHRDWTPEQWARILWSDETWITGGLHRKAYVTRRQEEALNPTCIVEKPQRKQGWMFWGSFSGLGKGPDVFWEKDWGSISAATYQQYIVPLVDGWIRLIRQEEGEDLVFMQDNAPGHVAKDTIADLSERRVDTMVWPPFSPDLNPIENCWN